MINVAVAGLGIGLAHVAGYLSHPQARLVAVADAWKPRRATVGGTFTQGAMAVLKPLFRETTLSKSWEELGCFVFESAEDLASAIQSGTVYDRVPGADPDAPWLVSLCTPDDTHEELAVLLLEAGCNVLLEKPLALTVDGALRVGQAAHDAGRRLALGYEFRVNPAVVELRRLVGSGGLGRPVAFALYHFRSPFRRNKWNHWIQERARSGGLIVEETCHWFDLARWIVGAEIDELVCHGTDLVHPDFDYEDIAFVQGRYQGGAVFQISHSLTGHDFSLILQVHGTEGTAWVGLKEEVYSSLDGGASHFLGILSRGVAGAAPADAVVQTWGQEATEPFNIRDAVTAAVDALLDGSGFAAGFSDGLRSLEVALAARSSLEGANPVRPAYSPGTNTP